MGICFTKMCISILEIVLLSCAKVQNFSNTKSKTADYYSVLLIFKLLISILTIKLCFLIAVLKVHFVAVK